jgi:hypothetical protein
MLNAILSDANQVLTTQVSELEGELNTWLTMTPDLGDLTDNQWASWAPYVEPRRPDVVEGLPTDESVRSASKAGTNRPYIVDGFGTDEQNPAIPYAETYQG